MTDDIRYAYDRGECNRHKVEDDPPKIDFYDLKTT